MSFDEPPDTHRTEQHASKIFAEANPTERTLHLILECDTCGRFELIAVPLMHLCTLAEVFTTVAQQLGVAPLTQELLERSSELADTDDEVEVSRAQFEAMPLPDPNALRRSASTGSSWDSDTDA